MSVQLDLIGLLLTVSVFTGCGIWLGYWLGYVNGYSAAAQGDSND